MLRDAIKSYERVFDTHEALCGTISAPEYDDMQEFIMDECRVEPNNIILNIPISAEFIHLSGDPKDCPYRAAPADGDDYTWQDTNQPMATNTIDSAGLLPIEIDTKRYGSVSQLGRVELYPERTENDALNIANISQRMTRLETELAELRAKVEAWEADS